MQSGLDIQRFFNAFCQIDCLALTPIMQEHVVRLLLRHMLVNRHNIDIFGPHSL